MLTTIVLSRIASDVDQIAGVLRAAGCDVRTPGASPFDPASAADAGVIVADIGVATAAGWLRGADPAMAPAPVVVMSRFAAFLTEISRNVSAVIHLPATDESIVAAVRRAAGISDAALDRPTLPRDPFDAARDRKLAERGLLRPKLRADLSALRPDLSAELADLLARALSFTPSKRPDSAVAFSNAVVRALDAHEGAPRTQRPLEPRSRGGVFHTPGERRRELRVRGQLGRGRRVTRSHRMGWIHRRSATLHPCCGPAPLPSRRC